MIERAHAEEPVAPPTIRFTIELRWLSGDNDGAIALAKTARPATRVPELALVYASQGRVREAADVLDELTDNPAALEAARLLRTAPAEPLAYKLPELPPALQFVYVYVGAPERSIAFYERRIDDGLFNVGNTWRVWHPSYAPVRKTERFKQLVRKAGLVEYWRAKGWPPQCHPTTGDDFECN